jgi:hypothetical protein
MSFAVGFVLWVVFGWIAFAISTYVEGELTLGMLIIGIPVFALLGGIGFLIVLFILIVTHDSIIIWRK